MAATFHKARVDALSKFFSHHLTIGNKETPTSYSVKQIEKYYEQYLRWRASATKVTPGIPSLQKFAIKSLVKALRDDKAAGADIIAKHLAPSQLANLVDNPGLHYSAFRVFHDLDSYAEALQRLKGYSIDEWIHKNEKWIRDSESMEGLVTLDDTELIWPRMENSTDENGAVVHKIVRQNPPKKGFAFLDACKDAKQRVITSTQVYINTFHAYTNNILQGLDWTGVVIAGGMAFNVLVQKNDKKSDLDLYIYGMTIEEANKKVEHIYEVWRNNLPEESRSNIVVIRNMKTINFIPKYPHRRVQIILKLNQSPAEVLLNFDLDPCAMGFTGDQLYMLPRAARSIETGYTIFTMSLIYGHHLSSRRASQDSRVFEYADRGFGIYITPEYCENVSFDARYRGEKDAEDFYSSSEFVYADKKEHPTVGTFSVTGLRGLKMVDFIARDMVHRYCIGKTKYTGGEERWQSDYENQLRQYGTYLGAAARKGNDEEKKEEEDEEDSDGDIAPVAFWELDQGRQHTYLPGGRRSLGGFELFMRHVTLWNLDAQGKVNLVDGSFTSNEYDETEYSDYVDLPSYKWQMGFKLREYLAKLDAMNLDLNKSYLYGNGREASTEEPMQRTVHALNPETLTDMLNKNVRIPLIIASDFETYCEKVAQDVLLKNHITENVSLFADIGFPVPQDPWRVWSISKELMWAKIDRKLDEVFEMLSIWFRLGKNTGIMSHYANIQLLPGQLNPSVVELMDMLDRRVMDGDIESGDVEPLPRRRKPSSMFTNSWRNQEERPTMKESCSPAPPLLVQYEKTKEMTWPSPWEVKSFCEWLRDVPNSVQRTYTQTGRHDFSEHDNDFLPELADYWTEEDEKVTDEDRVWYGTVPGMPHVKEPEDGDTSAVPGPNILLGSSVNTTEVEAALNNGDAPGEAADISKRKREESFNVPGETPEKPQSKKIFGDD